MAQDATTKLGSEKYGYTVESPRSWMTVPDEILSEHADRVLEPDSKVLFDAALQPDDIENWLDYPYVLIQVTPYRRLGIERTPGLEDIRGFVRDLAGPGVTAGPTGEADSAFQKPHFDEAELRLTHDADNEVPDGGVVRARAVARFGRTAFVQAVYYDRMEDWSRREDERAQLLDSLAFLPAFVLSFDNPSALPEAETAARRDAPVTARSETASGSSSGPTDHSGIDPALLGAWICAGIAVVMTLALVLTRKKNRGATRS